MKQLPEEIIKFFKKKGIVNVTTINENGQIHCAVKSIVGIEKEGMIFVIDLFHNRTFNNIKRNPTITITAVDEDKFIGYSIQGKAKIVLRQDIHDSIVEKWEKTVIKRISDRVIKSLQTEKKTQRHHEAELPHEPQYVIEIDTESIVDLAPPSKSINR